MFRTLATSFFSRKAAQRVSRLIPNPLLRAAVVTGATFIGPMLLRRVTARRKAGTGSVPRKSRGVGRLLGR